MTKKELEVLNASKAIFVKYGYTKTTMNDIAEAVGISRPGLYLIYPKKEEIFKALILMLSQELSAEVKKRNAKLKEPLLKLREVMNIWVVETYTWLNQSPESAELYENEFSFTRNCMQKSTDLFISDLEEVLKLFPHKSFNNDIEPRDVAVIISSAVIGIKKQVDDLDDLKRHIDLLIRICIKI
ncbi:MAG: TetR/AcrR family transcriptional regulator [Zunongwangia sp.]|uniref:Transcriptional regulator, TetR family n=1 Tax=Salegentibacter echinorum TaxID=1073325 RepID=A0A1M5IC36_SALEC|nr:TetR/AcrR family transcriptional regulator [Salegentibacter echinorum]SHG25866.1 transcriptional regulator, TetR family [Salegentibacter echinorum]